MHIFRGYLKKEWESASNKCSLEWMTVIIKQRERLLGTVGSKLRELEKHLDTYTGHRDFDMWDNKINQEVSKYEMEVRDKKNNKFSRDTNDYEQGHIFRWQEKF